MRSVGNGHPSSSRRPAPRSRSPRGSARSIRSAARGGHRAARARLTRAVSARPRRGPHDSSLQLYTQLPERCGIPAGAPIALLVDRNEQEIALLDDRVTSEQLAGIRADSRWNGATFGGVVERQGIWLMAAWGLGAVAVTVGIGLLLVLL